MIRRAFAFLLALWLATAPVAALAVPASWTTFSGQPSFVQLGVAQALSVASKALTTTNDAPKGSTILVWAACNTACTSIAVSDSNSDTFTVKSFTWDGAARVGEVAYVINTGADLPAGSTITITPNASATIALAATDIVGANGGGDVIGARQDTAGTSASVANGALAQATEVVCGATFLIGNGQGAWTEASGFTSENQQTAGGPSIMPACQVVLSTSTVTYAPSWVTSETFSANVWSWKWP